MENTAHTHTHARDGKGPPQGWGEDHPICTRLWGSNMPHAVRVPLGMYMMLPTFVGSLLGDEQIVCVLAPSFEFHHLFKPKTLNNHYNYIYMYKTNIYKYASTYAYIYIYV